VPFNPAVADQRFVLDAVVRINEIAGQERFAVASSDVVEAVLDGIGAFAAGEWEPLRRAGDTVGAQWSPTGVTMPAGYREAYQSYVEGGWGTIGVPEAFGGQGMPFVVQTAVLDTLGGANMGFALCPTLTVGAIEALSHHGNPAQQESYLPKLATGEWTGTMNLTEPQAGSDVGAVRSRAEPRGNGKWAITGQKIFISFGDHDMADNIVHLVLARTPDAPPGTKGLSLFLVPKYRLDDEGNPSHFNDVRVVSIEHKLGLHASPTCILSFGDNGDCLGELIGPELGGMRAMFTMMNNARLNVGLQGVQVAEAATQIAVQYARDRVQSARALVYLAASQVDRATLGEEGAQARLDLLTPLAKAHGTDIGCEVSSLAVQVHGGMGYIEETGVGQFFRDARITPIYEGTNGIQAADLVGRKLSMDNGGVLQRHLADMRAEALDTGLSALIDACDEVARRLLTVDVDDRLAASYPFLTMLSVATCGWLMERMGQIAANAEGDPAFLKMKQATARFYVEQIVPEALGLKASAMAPAEILYALAPEDFAV